MLVAGVEVVLRFARKWGSSLRAEYRELQSVPSGRVNIGSLYIYIYIDRLSLQTMIYPVLL